MSSALFFDNPGKRTRVSTPDGLAIEVREWGNPDGPELLLVPGLAQSYLSFARQFGAPELQHMRIISYDPRGHGLSDKPLDGTYYYEGRRWADEVQAVIDGTGLVKPVLAGWSMGGRIVRQYLMNYGDSRLSGVGIISARPIEVDRVIGPGNNITAALDVDNEASRIGTAISFLRNCFHIQPTPEEFEFMLGFNMLTSFEIRAEIGKWATDVAVSTRALEAVRVPAMIFHGRKDILVLPEAAEISATAMPKARVSIYDDCGHSVFFEAPDRFNRELAAFVDESWGQNV